ncbi:MAG: TetR/AcrR family transcriptional regulator [Bacteroidales bacterium]|nr:TetR/AcrR family transcriptional regulator [Bacteroidales bacterium]
MARITDPSKLEKIKEATISLIVEKGYGGASVSAIAAKAGVAEGYLYRHYTGKNELVHQLFNENIHVFIEHVRKVMDEYINFESFLRKYILGLVELINRSPDKTKFFVQLINDFTFEVSDKTKKQVFSICNTLLKLGKKKHEISDSCTIIDIYTVIVIIPLQVFSLYLKGFFGKVKLDKESASMVATTCLKIVRK